MKICGFTIIRNALKFDYPVIESIQSILPICDEFLVSVGQSDDNTLALIQSIKSPKIKIIESDWDDNLREGGKVLAVETNKAFNAIGTEFDWCFYIQSDEVVHERDLPKIKEALEKYKDVKEIDGLLFNYLHFYASYQYIGASRNWYRKEIRIIKNNKLIQSYKDAQGFRKQNQKLVVQPIDANIYHYGWVKHPSFQKAKELSFNKFWHSDEWMKNNIKEGTNYDYLRADIIREFEGNHPAVMQQRIAKMDWKLNFDPTQMQASIKFKITSFIEKYTDIRIGEYKNYKLR
jgi:hypothetical protein